LSIKWKLSAYFADGKYGQQGFPIRPSPTFDRSMGQVILAWAADGDGPQGVASGILGLPGREAHVSAI
jgi:hypothetical protein